MPVKSKIKKACLAYSGGLDTSVIIPWLKENYGCEVVAVAVDVGQAEETSGLAEKAKKTGASEFHLIDARDEFAKDYIFPVLKAGAVYEHDYLLGTATARPLIAKKQVEIALKTGCDAFSHGCTGKGNDQVRFELAYMALAPELAIVAPWREWDIRSREDAIDYAAARGIPVPVTKKDPYSRDRNLWHISHEGGPLEEPGFEPEESMFKLTTDPRKAPDEPERIVISFEAGLPVAVNGKRLGPVALIETLNTLGGRHGVGRVDIVENRLIGIKSRGVYETPGGTLLVQALRALETLTLDRDSVHEKE
ncbi:MAG TPA: argininosuccinate synthase, partial [Thermoanaerobaculia bacterium]|nr:argininosuccinate synthase [Thermoanaerobaculia bacterium]